MDSRKSQTLTVTRAELGYYPVVSRLESFQRQTPVGIERRQGEGGATPAASSAYRLHDKQDVALLHLPGDGIEHMQSICHWLPGATIDQTIGALVVERLTPLTLEVTLVLHQELQARYNAPDQLRHKAMEQHQYEAALAQRLYL